VLHFFLDEHALKRSVMVNNERSSMVLLFMFIAIGLTQIACFYFNLLMACKYRSGVSPEAATW
jgi:uncharacterized membrane protein SpoIIM required for sporulation